MKTVKQIKEARKVEIKAMQAIHAAAVADNSRSFTTEERTKWDAHKTKLNQIDLDLDVAERAEQLELEAADNYIKGQNRSTAKVNSNPETHWRDNKGGELRVYKPEEKIVSEERAEITFGEVAKALLTGPKTEVEKRFLSEGVDANGGFLVPTVLGNEFVDLFRAKSHVVQAGARTVDLTSSNLSLAKLLTDPTVAWRNEGTDVTETAATFGKVTWEAKSIAAYVPVTRELLQDAANMASILSNALSQAMAQEIDRVCLRGTGVAPEPKGIRNYTGTQTMALGANGGTITSWDILLDALERMYNVNAGNPTAAIMHGRTLTAFNKLKDSTNQPLQKPDAIKNLPLLETSKIPTNLTKGTASGVCSEIYIGDFTQLYIGVRQGIQLEISNIPLLTKLQTVFVVHARVDVAAIRENNFVLIPDVKPA